MKIDHHNIVVAFTIAWLSFSLVITGQNFVRFRVREYAARSPELRQDLSGDIANKTARQLYNLFPEAIGQDIHVFSDRPLFTLPLTYWLYPSRISLVTPDAGEPIEDQQLRIRRFLSRPGAPVLVYIGDDSLLANHQASLPPGYSSTELLRDGSTVVKRFSL